MADIKIRHMNTAGGNREETSVEVTGVEYGADELTKAITNAPVRTVNPTTERSIAADPTEETEEPKEGDGMCRVRRMHGGYISPDILVRYREEGRLDELISPFDEIDVPLDTGETVMVQCGYSEPNMARFVFKNCWDEAVMNDEATNKTGYHDSKGRKHMLEDIWPHIAPEWKAIIRPRRIIEEIGGEKHEYCDPLWLPSATDVFGTSEDGYWKDIDGSFQLPIFHRERDRVKECGDNGTYPYWLRSVNAGSTYAFRRVYTDGSGNDYGANSSGGFAPGFDI